MKKQTSHNEEATIIIRRYVELVEKEPSMRAMYPPGTCNAEDAWREYLNDKCTAWEALKNLCQKKQKK